MSDSIENTQSTAKSFEGIGLAYLVGACAMTMVLTLIAALWIVDYKLQQANPPKFVTVNTLKIMQKKTEDLVSSGGVPSPEVYAQEGRQFGAALTKVLNDLANDGYVVLNSSAVITGGKEYDMTEYVAKQLKVDLNKTVDYNAIAPMNKASAANASQPK